ncbi:hypothetical protein AAMO2058_001237400 [Amorphochlora amoebiformis]
MFERSMRRQASVDPSAFRHMSEPRYGSLPQRPKRKVIIGVCAATRKTSSDAMAQILDRLKAYGEFDIVVWGEETVLDEKIPIEEWPVCDCLIAFASSGFPIKRVQDYVQLRQPFCINNVFTQDIFENRMMTYELLEKYGIPTFRHIYADRRNGKKVNVKETDDYIELDGYRMKKPFVEKPFEGSNHNIYIYYSKEQGGGCRKLFRKVKNKSSEFFPHVKGIRRDGNYCYEQFIKGVKDLKVYTIGPNYAHGEVRKSPAVDGIVARNPDGKEMRLLTLLTPEERDIARRIVTVFQQNICGFDIIRTNGRAYVIDVNGWSFVKGNMRYYDKCARTIRKLCLGSISYRSQIHAPPKITRERVFRDGDNRHILLSLVTVFRHGDRTPKRKLKLKVSHAEVLWMFKNTRQEVKLKKRKQIIPFLKALNYLIHRLETSSSLSDREQLSSLRIVRSVIEEDRKGLKIQLKPRKIIEGRVTECLLACKWGGTLTRMGMEQAKFYAPVYWSEMLRGPTVNGRLTDQAEAYTKYKNTRHEFLKGLQVYAAAESRVKSSAKAFIRETSQKEDIPPHTLHSDNKVQAFLDDVTKADKMMDLAKRQVKKFVTARKVLVQSDPRYMPSSIPEHDTKTTGGVQCGGVGMGKPGEISPRSKDSAKSTKSCAEDPGLKKLKKLHKRVTKGLNQLVQEIKENDSMKPCRKQFRLGQAALARQKFFNGIKDSHDLTEWELRCLRWLKVPKNALKDLFNHLVALNRQIQDHVVESRKKRTPIRTPVLTPKDNTGTIPPLSLVTSIRPGEDKSRGSSSGDDNKKSRGSSLSPGGLSKSSTATFSTATGSTEMCC